MRDEQVIRRIFLEEFTKELILAYKLINGIRYYPIRKVKARIKRELPEIPFLPVAQVLAPEPIFAPPLPPPRPAPIFIAPPPRPIIPPPVQQPVQYTPPPVQAAPPVKPTKFEELIPTIQIGPINVETLRLLGLEKLAFLLLDPSVLSVECPGQGKQILVNRANVTQLTNIFLIKEEIDTIIRILSEKTRIPLIIGVFKVAFGNFIITAVISEFVGTRFIIQKRQPPTLLPVSPFAGALFTAPTVTAQVIRTPQATLILTKK